MCLIPFGSAAGSHGVAVHELQCTGLSWVTTLHMMTVPIEKSRTQPSSCSKIITVFSWFNVRDERLSPPPPSLGVFSPIPMGRSAPLQVFFSQPPSVQNANPAPQPLAAQQVICYTLCSHRGTRVAEPCFAVY